MGKINLYTIVTNDEYELPVKCDVRVADAADFLGVTDNKVRKMVCVPLKKSRYKVIVSGTIQHNEQEYQKLYCMTHDRQDRREYFREYYQKRRKLENVKH